MQCSITTNLDMTQSRGELDLIGSNSKSVRTNTVYDRGELEGANSIGGESGGYLLLLKKPKHIVGATNLKAAYFATKK